MRPVRPSAHSKSRPPRQLEAGLHSMNISQSGQSTSPPSCTHPLSPQNPALGYGVSCPPLHTASTIRSVSKQVITINLILVAGNSPNDDTYLPRHPQGSIHARSKSVTSSFILSLRSQTWLLILCENGNRRSKHHGSRPAPDGQGSHLSPGPSFAYDPVSHTHSVTLTPSEPAGR
eukprot:1977458-Rhodomonas_salina.2